MNKSIQILRMQFREWYSALSVEEILLNRVLIQKIECLERRLTSMVEP